MWKLGHNLFVFESGLREFTKAMAIVRPLTQSNERNNNSFAVAVIIHKIF